MINKIKNIKEKVKRLLSDIPHLRDSDEKLIATIWWMELNNEQKNFNAFEFLKLFSNSNLSSIESITRARRLIQEQNIELRGLLYKERKNKSQIVKKQIKTI